MDRILGITSRKVALIPHQASWADLYSAEKNMIISVTGQLIVAVEHVGSTAIPGIHAKPIIDVAVGVRDLSEADAMQPAMESIGYDYPRDVGIADERVFGKGSHSRTHLVHVMEHDAQVWHNYLHFREALLGDPDLAAEYDRIKLDLAREFPNDRPRYTYGKATFIERVLTERTKSRD